MKASSASNTATHSPLAASSPAFLAADGPPFCGSVTSRTRLSALASCRTTATVASVEASSTTNTSSGARDCVNAEATARPTNPSALYAAISTVIEGVTAVNRRESRRRSNTRRVVPYQLVIEVLERLGATPEVELLLHVAPAGLSHGCGRLAILEQPQQVAAQTGNIPFLESETRDPIDDAFADPTPCRSDDRDCAGLSFENDDWKAFCIAILCGDTG